MDFVHCNICRAQPNAEISIFYVSTCYHIFCGNCENEGSTQCKLCSTPCSLMKISPEMPQDFKNIFVDSSREILELLKVMSFQQQNSKLIINQYLPQLEKRYLSLKEAFTKQSEKLREVEEQLKKYQEVCKILSNENEQLRRKLWNAMSSPPSNYSPSLPSTHITAAQGLHQNVAEHRLASDLQSSQRQSRPTMIDALRQTRYNPSGMQQSRSSTGQFKISSLNNNISSTSGCASPSRMPLNKSGHHYYKSDLHNLKPSFNI